MRLVEEEFHSRITFMEAKPKSISEENKSIPRFIIFASLIKDK
jgi:hypothetical protein